MVQLIWLKVFISKFVNFRLDKAAAKIESLKGSKKAIRIYSSAKYPIANPPKFIPTFVDEFATSDINFDYNLQNIPFESSERYSDKLQFFHLKRSRQLTHPKPSLVFTTQSVNSLITFVNNENILLNEPTPKERIRDQAPLDERDISDTTDFSRFSTLLKSKHGDEFQYFPNMNQAPDVELPKDLPNLTGIADDISFTASDQDLIVPSLAKMNIVNELPNVSDLIIKADESKRSTEAVQKSKEAPTVEPNPLASVPPPPPPPIPSNFIPMPPPAPPQMKATEISQPKQQQVQDSGGEARSSLMQAIRNAGGKSKLKSVPAADEQEPVNKSKPHAAPAGNLMDEMKAKMELRRRGIAGTKQAKKEEAGSSMNFGILGKVSTLIPPPATDSDDTGDSSSDNDWN